MQLKQLQTNFVCSLLQKQQDENLAQWINARLPRRAVDCFDIYRQSRVARLTKVLQNTFVVCLALVGEHYFKQLCVHYMNSHFFKSHDITLYGIDFPKFVNDTRYKQHLDYLPDVAALEWAYFHVHYQGKIPALDLDVLAQIPSEQQPFLKFRLGYSHRLLQSDFPILAIWQAHQQAIDFETLHLDAEGCQLLIYRRNWEVVLEKLSAVEFLFLSCVSKEMCFEEIWATCLSAFPDAELTALFPKAVERGWINEFYL